MGAVIKTISDQETTLALSSTNFVAQASRAVINSTETIEKASDLLKAIKNMYKKSEDDRTSLVQPLNDTVKEINKRYKVFTEPLLAAEKTLKDKIGVYQMAIQKAAEAAETKRRAEEQEEQRKQREEAAKSNPVAENPVEAVEETLPVVKAPPKMTRGNFGSSQTRIVWTFEITDPALVPHAFCVPSEKAIRDAVDLGEREIAGVRIFEKPVVSSR